MTGAGRQGGERQVGRVAGSLARPDGQHAVAAPAARPPSPRGPARTAAPSPRCSRCARRSGWPGRAPATSCSGRPPKQSPNQRSAGTPPAASLTGALPWANSHASATIAATAGLQGASFSSVLDKVGGGDEHGGIAGAARRRPAPGSRARSPPGRPRAPPGWRTRCRCRGCRSGARPGVQASRASRWARGQVGHVDVVADAGPVRRRVVRAVDPIRRRPGRGR